MQYPAPALAAGNCVVIKPSEHASATTLEFARFVEQAGFPMGVVNVVTGDAKVGRSLLSSGCVDHVSFTGSPGVGREIAANAGRMLTPVTLELGGKSPNIIFEDADLDEAIVGAGRDLRGDGADVHRRVAAVGAEGRLQARVGGVGRTGQAHPPWRPHGPRDGDGSRGQRAAIQPHPADARGRAARWRQARDGARLATGGHPAKGDGLQKGLFVEPTIFVDADNAMTIAQEEVFGPVLSIIPFDTEEEAVEIGNETKYGLASGIWTTNLSRALRMSRATTSGMVWVDTYRAIAAQAPFGGFKDSGLGRERGEIALDEFTSTKSVMIDFSDAERDPFAIES